MTSVSALIGNAIPMPHKVSYQTNISFESGMPRPLNETFMNILLSTTPYQEMRHGKNLTGTQFFMVGQCCVGLITESKSDGQKSAETFASEALDETMQKFKLYFQDQPWVSRYIKEAKLTGNYKIAMTQEFRLNRRPLLILFVTLVGLAASLLLVSILNRKAWKKKI